MRKDMKGNCKKVIALVLSLTMAVSMNMTSLAEEFYDIDDTSVLADGNEYAAEDEEIIAENEFVPEDGEIIVENDYTVEDEAIIVENEFEETDVPEDDIVCEEMVDDSDITDTEDDAVVTEDEPAVAEVTEDGDTVTFNRIQARYLLFALGARCNPGYDSSDKRDDDGYSYEVFDNCHWDFNDESKDSFEIDSSKLDQVTDLEINFGRIQHRNLTPDFPKSDWQLMPNHINSMLAPFQNLKRLTIVGKVPDNENLKLRNLSIPNSVETLIIRNCTFVPENVNSDSNALDISNCWNLEYFEFTDNDVSSTDLIPRGITGLDSSESQLKKLEFLKMKNSNVCSIHLASNPVAEGLAVVINNCAKLTSFDSGGYKLMSSEKSDFTTSPSFRACNNLETFCIKGVTNSAEQKIDLGECTHVSSLSIQYFFSDAGHKVNIYSPSVSSSSGFFTVGRLEGSAAGKYKITAIKDSYLIEGAKSDTYKGYFESVNAITGHADYIIFAQEKEKWDENQLWNDAAKRRDYDANPVVLRVGQTIDDNRALCYTQAGDIIQEVDFDDPTCIYTPGTYKYDKVPFEVTKEGSNFKVKALAPGEGYLKVNAKDGGNAERSQKIIVVAPVKSLSIHSDSVANAVETNPKLIDEPGKSYVYTSMGSDYPDRLSKGTLGGLVWDIYKKNKNGDWENYNNMTTSAGVKVYADSETGGDKVEGTGSGSTLKKRSAIEVTSDTTGGEFYIKARVSDNYTNGKSYEDDKETIGDEFIWIDKEYYFNIINVSQSCSEIQFGHKYAYYEIEKIPEEATITATDLDDKSYDITAKIKNEEKYKGCIILTPAEGCINKYTLSFNKAKSPEEISAVLDSLGSNNCSATVEVTIKAKNGTFNKTYNKTVSLKGKFYLEYDLKGGSVKAGNPSYYILPIIYANGRDIPNNPTKKGYKFAGWYSGNNKYTDVRGGVSKLTAKWDPEVYNITYKLDGGKNSTKNPATYKMTSADITLQKPVKTGYAFEGWYTDSKFTKKITTIAKGSTGNKTLYAKWKINTYTITYKLNSGKNSSKNPASYKVTTSDITLRNPTRTGYTFKGWYTDSKFTRKITVIKKGSAGNKTVYAKWEANKYTIKYNSNGGNGTVKNQSMTYDKSAKLTKNSYTRSGYTFLGWNTDKNAKTAKYKNQSSVKNLTNKSGGTVTLYAIWKKK